MKFIKWKPLIITSIICLSPILLGIALWDILPDTIAIHFNIYNQPDNFTSKEFAVFGLPLMMVVLQAISCLLNDINSHKHGENKKFERVTIWIIPVITLLLYVVTLGYSLGWNIDIRRVAGLIVGVMLLLIGNYLPKLDYVKNYDLDAEKARKINRFVGIETVIMGGLMLISLIFPPIVTALSLFLFIPYTFITILYTTKVRKSK